MSSKVKVTMTLNDLETRVRGLQKLSERDLPVKGAYRLGKLLRVMSEELNDSEKVRLQLLQKYAEKNKDGSLVIEGTKAKILPKNQAKWNEDWRELVSQEITIEALPLNLKDFGNINVSAKELFLLGDFLLDE